MSDRRRLIFATCQPPFPLDNGGRIRTHRLAKGLADSFDVTLVTYADGPVYDETSSSRADLEAVLPGLDLELVPFPPGARTSGPLVAATPGSVSYGIYDQPPLREALRELVRRVGPCVLHLDEVGAGLAGIGAAAAVTVYSSHNVEHKVRRALAKQSPWDKRLQLEVEWRKVRAEERRVARSADLSLACSEIDARWLRSAGARNVEVCPNGADPHDPLVVSTPGVGDPLRLLFVGSGLYWPYEQGLQWFTANVLPRIRERFQVEFDVVGSRPDTTSGVSEVTYHGRVPDVVPHYQRSHALIVPVFEGSGTRLKILESMALGRTVISTTLGAEGLPIRHGEHYLQADDADAFVAAIAQLRDELCERPNVAIGRTVAARRAIEPLFWPAVVADLSTVYHGLLDDAVASRLAET